MKHSKNSNPSFVFFSAIIFIVLVVIMFYTFRHTVITKEMSEGFRGGGGGHGFSGSRGMGSMPGRGFSAAGYSFPNRGQNIGRTAALAGGTGIMRNQNFNRPQGRMNHGGGHRWNKDRRNWNYNNWYYGAAALPFLGGYFWNKDGYDSTFYPDYYGYNEPNITNVYNIYNNKKTEEEESNKKSDW